MRMARMTETKISDEQALAAAGRAEPGEQPVPAKPNGVAARQVVGRVTELGEETVGDVSCEDPFIVTDTVNVFYGDNHEIQDV